MKTPTALSVTSSQREQTSLRSQVPRLPRSNVCSTRDLENRSASVHRKRFSTPSLTLKFLCAGKLNPRQHKASLGWYFDCDRPRLLRRPTDQAQSPSHAVLPVFLHRWYSKSTKKAPEPVEN